jgi:hypothetical protein
VDRTIPQVGQLPVIETFSLIPQRNAMIGIGALAQAVIGEQSANPAVAIDGFVLSPAAPPSLVINVGPGSIYAQGVVDQNSYGVLPPDVTDIITQQGISLGTTSLTFTPPGTVGFSTNYVIQIGLSVQDIDPLVNPFYNASNPPSNWSGPNNSFTTQNTVRQCAAIIQAKAGIPASSGTQITPAPDPGFFGVYSVTVVNGATALTSGNWSTLSTAPFIPAPLMAIPQAVQSNKWTFAEDTGTANALVVALTPAPLAIVDGMEITVEKGVSANTGPSTLVVNGSAPIAIHNISGNALAGNEMPPGAELRFIFDGVFWQLQNVTAASFGGPLFDGDATGVNNYTISNLTPSIGALFNRMLLKASFATPNNAAATLNVGFGVNPIVYESKAPLTGGEITDQHLLTYSTALSSWEILTPTKPSGAPQQLSAPQTYYIGGGSASDANNGLTLATAFATFAHCINVIAGFNLNNYSITVIVANGTYNIASSIILPAVSGSGSVNFIGNVATPSLCTINSSLGSCLLSIASTNFNFSGFKFTCSASNPAFADPGGAVYVDGTGVKIGLGAVEFGACQGAHLIAVQGAQILFGPNPIIISGGLIANAFASGNFVKTVSGGNVTFGPVTTPSLTITVPVSIPIFIFCDTQSLVFGSFSSITGASNVTGQKYFIGPLSLINTGGFPTTYFPGTIAGAKSADGSGVYA